MPGLSRAVLLWLFERLLAAYGPQEWWPADSPFEVMTGAVLTQNTAWTNVEKALKNLKANQALDPLVITGSADETLAGWLRPSGYFNVKARRLKAFCSWYLQEGGEEALGRLDTPELRSRILAVHGIGPEIADDILLYAFDRPVFVIDAYTRRLLDRMALPGGDLPYEQLRIALEKALGPDLALYNEFHALIVIHGKERCRVKPRCHGCPLINRCLMPKMPR